METKSLTRQKWDGVVPEPAPVEAEPKSKAGWVILGVIVLLGIGSFLLWPQPTKVPVKVADPQTTRTRFINNSDPDNVLSFDIILDDHEFLIVLNLTNHEELVTVQVADGLWLDYRSGKSLYAINNELGLSLNPYQFMLVSW